MNDLSNATAIETIDRPTCPACGASGTVRYIGLRDAHFGSPGSWKMRRCDRPTCATMWLDPAPSPRALPSLYTNYYTHASLDIFDTAVVDPPVRNRAPERRAFWARRFGYPYRESLRVRLRARVFDLLPIRRARLENDVFYLRANPGGRVIELGCGRGDMVASLASHGWRATGLDFDARAVESARAQGLDVQVGDLDAGAFADHAFDAVVSRHVIEHTYDPYTYWATCMRLLVAGGIAVVVTPNVRGLGHRWFGARWRGLETPRHLSVYSPQALKDSAQRAGLDVLSVRTSILGVRQVFKESGAPKWLLSLVPLIEAAGYLASRLGGKFGEETVLIARRPRA